MRVRRVGKAKEAHRLRTRALWLCLLAGVFAIAMAARPELRSVLAQSSSPPAASRQDSVNPAQEPSAQARPQEPLVQQEPPVPPPSDPRQKNIAEDSANLLKLANRLKDEVDNTTVDTLSITAIQDAKEIEKLAHKMRGK